jgi:hypothetical protein
MNTYRIRSSGALMSESELRLHFEKVIIDGQECNRSLPVILGAAEREELGFDPVLESPAPTVTAYQSVQRDGVVQDGLGNWVHAWKVTVLEPEQIEALKNSKRIEKREAIKAHRDALQVAGCPVGTDWFHNDVKSRGQWERMVNRVDKEGLANDAPYTIAGQPVPWQTMAGDSVLLTAGKIRAVVAAMEVREAVLFAVAKQHIAAVNAVADPAAYIFTGPGKGWPAQFVPPDGEAP